MSAVHSYEIGRYFLMSLIRVFIRSDEDIYHSRDVFQGASKMLLRKGLFDPTIGSSKTGKRIKRRRGFHLSHPALQCLPCVLEHSYIISKLLSPFITCAALPKSTRYSFNQVICSRRNLMYVKPGCFHAPLMNPCTDQTSCSSSLLGQTQDSRPDNQRL